MPTQKLLLPLVQHYIEDDPVAAARTIQYLKENDAVKILKAISSSAAVKLFPYLQTEYAAKLLREAPLELFQNIVSRLDPQQGASIFMDLKEDERQKLVENLPSKTKELIRELISFPMDSVGRLMSTKMLALKKDMTVKEVIHKIRQLTKEGFPSSYVYVVDNEFHLVGVINMRDLMLAESTTLLESVMHKDVFSVNCFDDAEKVAGELGARRYFAAPVVDYENKLLGVIQAAQLINEISEEATEDLQKMFGAGGDERPFSPLSFVIKKRLPWLHINLATAFLAAAVVALFEGVIAKITVLAVFLPVVAGQGGNAGAQSLAVVMRGLVMREIPKHKIFKLVLKETKIGIINGIVIGIVTAIIAYMWQGNPYLGLVIGLGMIVNLLVAGLAGSGIPILMKFVGLDPAQSSSIVLTTVTDVVGFFAFLGFAYLFQSLIV